MKTLQNTNTTTSSFKTKALFTLIALLCLCFSTPAFASSPSAPSAMQQMTGSSVLLSLGETMSGSQIITVENLISDHNGFSGTWWAATPTENMQSIMFSNISGSTLPTNTEVALVTVNDPINGTTHQYVLGTDGGAIIMILGDF